MGEVMVSRNQSLNNVIDLMRKNGFDEEGAVKRIINLGIQPIFRINIPPRNTFRTPVPSTLKSI